MKKPISNDGIVIYMSNGDGYHESELQDLINTPRLRWIKIEPGCEMPDDNDKRELLLTNGFDFTFGYHVGPHWCSTENSEGYHYYPTHYAYLEFPR